MKYIIRNTKNKKLPKINKIKKKNNVNSNTIVSDMLYIS